MRTQRQQREHTPNRKNHFFARTGVAACGILALALAGCTTYVEQSPPRTVYVSPPPPTAPPPPVQILPPPAPVYVAPPAAEPAPADATVEVIHSDSDFYEPLSPYGQWVVVGSYGRCWRPARVEAGWRPYATGHWERTDAGWYWVSDEPWAWATYHYGRWDWSAQLGWFWVPHTQWAPAWVVWRQGGGYVGWAPMPPSAMIAVGGAVEIHEAAFAPRAFVFVPERHLLEPVRPTTVVVNNTTIINKTVNITRIQVVNKTVINDGPRADVIERESGRRIQPVAARELRHREEAEVVARHRTVPANAERTSPAPAARTVAAPGTERVPRESRPAENTAVVQEHTLAPVPQPRVGEVREPKAPTPAAHSKRELAARKEQQPRIESPKAARPEVRQEPKPTVLPRDARLPEQPSQTVTQPQSAGTRGDFRRSVEQPPAATPARPETARTPRSERQREARPAAEQPAARAVAGPLRSPKENSAAGEQGRANAKARERGRNREKAVTPLPPQ